MLREHVQAPMQTARYVISPEKETVRRRPSLPKAVPGSKPLPAPPANPDTWPLAAVLSVAGLVVIALLLTHRLNEVSATRQAEAERANAAWLQADTLGRRFFKLAAEYDQLSDDRRNLLRRISETMNKEAGARAELQKAIQAGEAAAAQTQLVALQWSEYSSGLEQTLDTIRSRALGLEGELQSERSASATQAEQMTREIEGLSSAKSAVEREAGSYQRLANELDATARNLRNEVSSLQSDRSSLESENRSLCSQNSQLRSEISCLNGRICSLQSEISSLRSQISRVK